MRIRGKIVATTGCKIESTDQKENGEADGALLPVLLPGKSVVNGQQVLLSKITFVMSGCSNQRGDIGAGSGQIDAIDQNSSEERKRFLFEEDKGDCNGFMVSSSGVITKCKCEFRIGKSKSIGRSQGIARSVATVTPSENKSTTAFSKKKSLQYVYRNSQGTPVANAPYKISTLAGMDLWGTLNENGYTQIPEDSQSIEIFPADNSESDDENKSNARSIDARLKFLREQLKSALESIVEEENKKILSEKTKKGVIHNWVGDTNVENIDELVELYDRQIFDIYAALQGMILGGKDVFEGYYELLCLIPELLEVISPYIVELAPFVATGTTGFGLLYVLINNWDTDQLILAMDRGSEIVANVAAIAGDEELREILVDSFKKLEVSRDTKMFIAGRIYGNIIVEALVSVILVALFSGPGGAASLANLGGRLARLNKLNPKLGVVFNSFRELVLLSRNRNHIVSDVVEKATIVDNFGFVKVADKLPEKPDAIIDLLGELPASKTKLRTENVGRSSSKASGKKAESRSFEVRSKQPEILPYAPKYYTWKQWIALTENLFNRKFGKPFWISPRVGHKVWKSKNGMYYGTHRSLVTFREKMQKNKLLEFAENKFESDHILAKGIDLPDRNLLNPKLKNPAYVEKDLVNPLPLQKLEMSASDRTMDKLFNSMPCVLLEATTHRKIKSSSNLNKTSLMRKNRPKINEGIQRSEFQVIDNTDLKVAFKKTYSMLWRDSPELVEELSDVASEIIELLELQHKPILFPDL